MSAVYGRYSRRPGTSRAGNCTPRTAQPEGRRAAGGTRMVGAAGVEPASPCGQRILSPRRLPFCPAPPPRGSEIFVLLFDLADALLPFLFPAEGPGLSLLF